MHAAYEVNIAEVKGDLDETSAALVQPRCAMTDDRSPLLSQDQMAGISEMPAARAVDVISGHPRQP